MALDQVAVSLPEPGLRAAGVKLNAILDGDKINLKEFSGTLNGGTFDGGGDLRFGGGKILDANLFLRGKDIFVEYPAGAKTMSSFDLKLASREKRLVLGGQIKVQEGYYESSFDLFGAPRDTGRGGAGTRESAAGALALDLKVVTERPVEMDNNLGRIAATADLRVAGTTDRPRAHRRRVPRTDE